ncbi:MAG: sugar transferase [Patescibacteria group bacterium]|nr:sugar transferase [Patescibacteria group bacterium]
MNNLTQKTKKLFLLGGDLTTLYFSLFLTIIIRYGFPIENGLWQKHFLPFTFIYLIWLVVFYIIGLYDPSQQQNRLPFYSLLWKSLAINSTIAIGFFYLMPNIGIQPKRVLLINILIFAVIFYFWRKIYNNAVSSSAVRNNLLIIELNKQSLKIIDKIIKNPQLGYKIIAIINSDENQQNINLPSNIKIITNNDFDLTKIIKQEKIQTIVSATDHRSNKNLSKQLYKNLNSRIKFFDLPRFYEQLTGKIPVNIINEIWFLENLQESEKKFYEFFKRIIDIILAILGLAISLPILPFLIIIIKLDSKGSIFFSQIRTGKNNKKFLAIKLRTMVDGAEKNGPQWAEKNDSRVTRVGKFLRKTRIDEIPQLFNVLHGEMSFIGPRPERPEFIETLEKHIPFYKQRLIIKPGLSGWAQINFPYGASINDSMEKMQYDLFYIKNRSAVLDLSITLKTINTILKGGGR